MKKYLEIKSRKAMGVRVKRPSNWWIHVIMVLAAVCCIMPFVLVTTIRFFRYAAMHQPA